MYKLEGIQCRAIRVLYKLNYASIVSISALMRSLGWLKLRYICIHRLLCITHTAKHRGFPEYLAQSITIQSSNRSSRKCHVMKLVQRSKTLSYFESAFSVIHYRMTTFVVQHHFHYLKVNCISILNQCNSFYFLYFFYFILLVSNDAYNHHVFLKS